MSTKTISIMEDAYLLLLRNKLRNESFSQVIRRTLTKKRDIMEFAGAWKHIKEEEIENMKEDVEKLRKKATKALLKRYDNDLS